MKRALNRDFFGTLSMVRSLKPGEQLVVTDHGQTEFVVVKLNNPPHRSTADLARLAAELLPGRRRKINVVEKLRRFRA